MKTITSDFKENINQLGRILDSKINIYENYLLSTENDKKILTQNDILLIANTQSKDLSSVLNSEHIFRVNVVQKGGIFTTLAKELDFESDVSINVGTVINYNFGLLVDDEFEYLDYGDFIVYKKEYNEDTKHYNYVCIDYMLKTMITADDFTIVENNLIANAITYIANKVNLNVNMTDEVLDEFPNLEKTIASGTFTDMDMTYRDVLDQICQAVGVSMYVDGDELKFKGLLTDVVDTIDKTYLKDVNVVFKEKYGKINSLVLSRSEDKDNIYRQDSESIEQNGLHEFKIKDNLILNGNDREEYIDNIFDQINGLEFYINDIESTGICYLDLLDFYNIDIDGNIYKCLLLNDEITINSGLSEKIYTETPEETVTDYKTSGKTDKEVSFIVDKQNAKINMKVSKGEVINEINLDESGATIRANKVNLVGYVTASDLAGTGTTVINGANITTGTINADKINGGTITASAINLGNNNFAVTTEGYLTAKRVNIIGGNIALQSNEITDNISVGGTSSSTGETIESRMGWGNFYLYRGGTSKVALYTGSTTQIGGQIRLYDASHNNPISLNGATGNITCISLTQTSLESQKKNFEKYDNALDTIKNIDIYKYNYINEDDDYKKHIGFVIGEKYKHSSEITSIDEENNENGVDLYSFVSVCCKAIQEQQEQIDKLKEEIELLKRRDN